MTGDKEISFWLTYIRVTCFTARRLTLTPEHNERQSIRAAANTVA